jgi:hypothetical protein
LRAISLHGNKFLFLNLCTTSFDFYEKLNFKNIHGKIIFFFFFEAVKTRKNCVHFLNTFARRNIKDGIIGGE